MNQEIYDEAAIFDLDGGLACLRIEVATKIANPKRRTLFVNLALQQIQGLEQLVKEMEGEEVERLSRELAPIHQSNGNGESPT